MAQGQKKKGTLLFLAQALWPYILLSQLVSIFSVVVPRITMPQPSIFAAFLFSSLLLLLCSRLASLIFLTSLTDELSNEGRRRKREQKQFSICDLQGNETDSNGKTCDKSEKRRQNFRCSPFFLCITLQQDSPLHYRINVLAFKMVYDQRPLSNPTVNS